MKLNEFIKKKSICIDTDFDSKKTLFKEIGKIIENETNINSLKIIEKLNEREMLGSTGVGEGVAIPHAKVDGLIKTIVLFFRLKAPVDFSASDKKKVDIIFTIIAPEDSQSEHLLILSSISNFLKKKGMLNKLRSYRNVDEIMSSFSKI